MISHLPLCCSPLAFDLLGQVLPNLESSEGLVHGAVAVATHAMPDCTVAEVEAQLRQSADVVRRHVRGSQPQAILAHLHDHLFDELGFQGNTDDYYNPNNSYLPAVLKCRRGLPITLTLIYKTIAEQLGLSVWGVGLPGHFLAAVEIDGSPMLVDTFAGGRVITSEEVQDRMHEILGPEADFTPELMQPVSNRIWLTRILQNLLTTFGSTGRYADVAAVLEMEMLLWPDQDRLQRDLALVLARLGLAQAAGKWLSKYLRNNPDDPQKRDLAQLLDVLQA